jgi:hypothetical protein
MVVRSCTQCRSQYIAVPGNEDVVLGPTLTDRSCQELGSYANCDAQPGRTLVRSMFSVAGLSDDGIEAFQEPDGRYYDGIAGRERGRQRWRWGRKTQIEGGYNSYRLDRGNTLRGGGKMGA